jgi:large-conductance mechanosensitive channel
LVVHGKIINSLEDVIMPIVGLLTGGVTQKFIALDGGHYDTLDALKWGLPLSPMVTAGDY